MTVISHQIPGHHSAVRSGAHRASRVVDRVAAAREVRRQDEAARRRQEALARLAQRRMPLPGAPWGAYGAEHPLAEPDGSGAGAGMTLVTSPLDEDAGPEQCTCRGDAPDFDRPALTTREVEVLRTWLKVDTKPAVAQELYISLGTVNTHLTRIRAKYADIGRPAPTKAALVARAVQDGLVALDEL
ncbi:LuxR C-terminal-related transcriptional regulator [Gordonia sp. PKS22-38]|uniref:LuxR C-terminal-related transcriptional regulator n=1 Tax=Gordonia prachuapensis TaxID=3115651 RepID=A0ABU7MSZ6_9ACTN|nr:LuxR C-terminal-related transcriptional regulator [Gordonia sp. PKS22-38]